MFGLTKQSGDKKKLRFFVFLKKMLIIQFPYMDNLWLAFLWWRHKKLSKYFWNCPENFFRFFFNRKSSFVLKQTFPKNFFFCVQSLIFCVRNVVLDTLMLDVFLFAQYFFQKHWQLFFVWYVYVCLDQCLIISKITNNHRRKILPYFNSLLLSLYFLRNTALR